MNKLPIVIFIVAVGGYIALWLSEQSYQQSVYSYQQASEKRTEKMASIEKEMELLRKETSSKKLAMIKKEVLVPTVSWSVVKRGIVRKRVPITTYRKKVIEVPEVAHVDDPRVVAKSQQLTKKIDEIQKEEKAQSERPVTDDSILGMSRSSVSFIFSLIICLASLFVILSRKYKQSAEKWAFASVGTIVGYWLG